VKIIFGHPGPNEETLYDAPLDPHSPSASMPSASWLCSPEPVDPQQLNRNYSPGGAPTAPMRFLNWVLKTNDYTNFE